MADEALPVLHYGLLFFFFLIPHKALQEFIVLLFSKEVKSIGVARASEVAQITAEHNIGVEDNLSRPFLLKQIKVELLREARLVGWV